ncbi:helix-turn-helix transcriptional regulator [Pedobacter sp. SAFR-022]|uniref:helix-turn-helix transcriptional regulator n=1 Tax=Pedobacter sp. SAFR-022 TaxID=3436861 RepID=UPI003F8199C6
MFKVKIRKAAEIILETYFEPAEYPLVNIYFSTDLLYLRYWYNATAPANVALAAEPDILLDLTLSEDTYMKLTGEFPITEGIDNSGSMAAKRVTNDVRSIIFEILHCDCQPRYREAYLKAKVSELLVMMLSTGYMEKPSGRWTVREIAMLTEIKELISLNLQNCYSIEQLAEISGMNRTKLQEGFKDLFGKTIFSYTTDMKMLKAKMLLEDEQGLSLKEIAGMLGYRHTNHFSAAFKKRYNFSPSQLKRS